jgi:hypothetical protein
MLPNGKCNENKPPELCPDGTVMPPSGTCVLGEIITRDNNPSRPDDVEGELIRNAPEEPATLPQVQGAILPFTGGDLFPLIALAGLLLASGVLFVRRSPTQP